jgi:hypothetical protein
VKRNKAVDDLSVVVGADRARAGEAGRSGISAHSKELMKNRTSAPYSNYGERLFKEGVASMEKKKKEAEAKRHEREHEEDEHLTFHPKISELARRIKSQGGLKAMDAFGEARQIQRDRLEAELRAQELAECTFKPTISKTSKRIVTRMRSMTGEDQPIYEVLYSDAAKRKMRVEDHKNWMADEYTFKPDIKMSSQYHHYDRSEQEFLDRLVYSKEKRQELLQHMRDKKIEEGIDPDTGERLFKPKTGRPPVNKREGSISDALFEAAKRADEARRQAEERAAGEHAALSEQPKVLKTSQKILDATLRSRLAEIFDALDTDHDGYIEPETVSGATLDLEVAKDIIPLVKTFTTKFVNKQHFVKAVFDKLHTSKTGPRAYLFTSRVKGGAAHASGPDHTASELEALTFRPAINAKSAELALAKGRGGSVPVHEALLKEGEEAARHRQRLYEERIEAELAECTFRPNVDQSRPPGDEPIVGPIKADELARRLSQKSVRSSHGGKAVTTEDMIFKEHCTFKPDTSHSNMMNASRDRSRRRSSGGVGGH